MLAVTNYKIFVLFQVNPQDEDSRSTGGAQPIPATSADVHIDVASSDDEDNDDDVEDNIATLLFSDIIVETEERSNISTNPIDHMDPHDSSDAEDEEATVCTKGLFCLMAVLPI